MPALDQGAHSHSFALAADDKHTHQGLMGMLRLGSRNSQAVTQEEDLVVVAEGRSLVEGTGLEVGIADMAEV